MHNYLKEPAAPDGTKGLAYAWFHAKAWLTTVDHKRIGIVVVVVDVEVVGSDETVSSAAVVVGASVVSGGSVGCRAKTVVNRSLSSIRPYPDTA